MLDIELSYLGKCLDYTSPTGKKTKLYNIGTLALALGRDSQTVRKWEIGGIIPKTPFSSGGRRLYSTEHIEAIVRCAEKSKIKTGAKMSQTSFTPWVYKEFERLNKEFFGEKKGGN